MKKMVKKIINTLLSLVVVFSALFGSSISAQAKEHTVYANQNSIFIPFRSDYTNYLSKYSSTKSYAVQYVWLKLFNEELHWTNDKPWFNPNFTSWTNKYYSDYVSPKGDVKSSKDIQITYNPEFDAFLYQTIINNPEFIINWINEQPQVFSEYTKRIHDHPILADGLIYLTSSGTYLGDGKDSDTNVFLMGANSTSEEKLNAKWTALRTASDTHDIDILRAFGSNYSSLNDTQKTWVKTYIEFLVDDYIRNRTNAIASLNNSSELYSLMAVSGYGFTRGEVNQEFFNYCINTPECKVGDLIANSIERFDKLSELRYGAKDICRFSDMGAIWASDADCDYGNDWPGGRSSGTNKGDEDYDWLCWNICFNNDSYYSTFRNLVEGHPTTKQQMEDWLSRYYLSPNNPNHPTIPSGSSSALIGKWGIGGCHLNLVETGSWDCSGHTDTSGTIRATKPIGAKTIVLTTNGNTYQYMYGSSLSYTIRNAYGQVISSGSAPKGFWSSSATISVPTKYIWQELYIEAHGTVEQGHKGHNSSGACISTAMAEYLHTNAPGLFPDQPKYHTMTSTYYYVDINACQRNGHSYKPAAYSWSPDHSHCICTMQCPNCNNTYTVTSTNVATQSYSDKTIYTATFGIKSVDESTTNSEQRSATVYHGSGLKIFTSDDISGAPAGIGYGSCTLAADKISPGPQAISINLVACDAVISLMNSKGAIVDQRNLSSGSTSVAVMDAVFDLSDRSDKDLMGLYIVINAQTIVKNYNASGNYIGNAFGPYRINQIKIEY